MESKYQSCAAPHVRHGTTENGYDNGNNRSATDGKIMAVPMMNNDASRRSVGKLIRESARIGTQYGPMKSQGRFINRSLQIQSMMTNKVNRYQVGKLIPGMSVRGNTR
jgi:hypothetical protein